MLECVSKCCISNDCDIAYLEGDNCYNQICKNTNDCLIFDNKNILSSITYISKNPYEICNKYKN